MYCSFISPAWLWQSPKKVLLRRVCTISKYEFWEKVCIYHFSLLAVQYNSGCCFCLFSKIHTCSPLKFVRVIHSAQFVIFHTDESRCYRPISRTLLKLIYFVTLAFISNYFLWWLKGSGVPCLQSSCIHSAGNIFGKGIRYILDMTLF